MAEHAERWLHKHLIFGRLMGKLGFSMKNLIFRYSNGKSWFFNLKYLVFQSKSDFHIEKLGFFISIEVPRLSIEKLDLSMKIY